VFLVNGTVFNKLMAVNLNRCGGRRTSGQEVHNTQLQMKPPVWHITQLLCLLNSEKYTVIVYMYTELY